MNEQESNEEPELTEITLHLRGGHAVVQLVEGLRYKPEDRGFDFRWCLWSFSLTHSLRPHYVPEVDSASNRNEYQKYFLVLIPDNLTTFMCRLS